MVEPCRSFGLKALSRNSRDQFAVHFVGGQKTQVKPAHATSSIQPERAIMVLPWADDAMNENAVRVSGIQNAVALP